MSETSTLGLSMKPYNPTEEQISFFNDNGYLVVEQLFSHDNVMQQTT